MDGVIQRFSNSTTIRNHSFFDFDLLLVFFLLLLFVLLVFLPLGDFLSADFLVLEEVLSDDFLSFSADFLGLSDASSFVFFLSSEFFARFFVSLLSVPFDDFLRPPPPLVRQYALTFAPSPRVKAETHVQLSLLPHWDLLDPLQADCAAASVTRTAEHSANIGMSSRVANCRNFNFRFLSFGSERLI